MYISRIDLEALLSLELRKSAEKIEYAVGGGGADDGSSDLRVSIETESNDGERACQGE